MSAVAGKVISPLVESIVVSAGKLMVFAPVDRPGTVAVPSVAIAVPFGKTFVVSGNETVPDGEIEEPGGNTTDPGVKVVPALNFMLPVF
jgi:hypothetical protein